MCMCVYVVCARKRLNVKRIPFLPPTFRFYCFVRRQTIELLIESRKLLFPYCRNTVFLKTSFNTLTFQGSRIYSRHSKRFLHPTN